MNQFHVYNNMQTMMLLQIYPSVGLTLNSKCSDCISLLHLRSYGLFVKIFVDKMSADRIISTLSITCMFLVPVVTINLDTRFMSDEPLDYAEAKRKCEDNGQM